MGNVIKVCIGYAGGSMNKWSQETDNFEQAAKVWNGLKVQQDEMIYMTVNGTSAYADAPGEHYNVNAEALESAAAPYLS